MKADPGRLVAVDALVIAVISIAISVASHRLLFMTAFVPAVLLLRFAYLYAVKDAVSVNTKVEVVFFLICTLFGAFNDWNSVCNHRIYDYTVPTYVSFSTIPVWMLLFWGMILRFIARLARWSFLAPDTEINNRIGIGKVTVENGWVRVAVMLLLVFATRQCIYRYYLDPVLSWLPFLAALFVMVLMFQLTRHDWKLIGIFLLGGPLIEILYIQVGDLHHYHLGWIGGVPLWIALWWLVIIVIWKDLSLRMQKGLALVFK